MVKKNKVWNSRKYRTAWLLTLLSTVVLVVPFIIGFWVNRSCPELIDGAQWLTFLAVLWSAYFSVNVASKHHAFQSKNSESEVIVKDPLKDGE